MKIFQITCNLNYGDGGTNCIFSLDRVLKHLNFQTIIAAQIVDARLKGKNIIIFNKIEELSLEKDDIIIYHFFTGEALNDIIEHLPYKKILVYQNVTPAKYFKGISEGNVRLCMRGVLDAETAAGNYLKSIVMSDFNKRDLVKYGWNPEDVSVIPLIEGNNDKQGVLCDSKIIKKFSDQKINFLFVGRVVKNKRFEDIIKIFAYYQKNYNANTRLILVGKIIFENYYHALLNYIEELGVQDVIFTNHVANEELEAYYSVSNLFLCMSEHEGFCMPIIEAMKKKIPVVAYAAAAVPDTMGGAGILVDTKDEKKVCEKIDRLFHDEQYRTDLIKRQTLRAEHLNIDQYQKEIESEIEAVALMKEYAYQYMKELKLEPEKGRNQWDYLKKNILDKDDVPIVIYGKGDVGQRLSMQLIEEGCRQIVAYCDNYAKEKSFCGLPVLNQGECLVNYPDAIYIVTIQAHFIHIIAELIKNGIKENQIMFFDNIRDDFIKALD